MSFLIRKVYFSSFRVIVVSRPLPSVRINDDDDDDNDVEMGATAITFYIGSSATPYANRNG